METRILTTGLIVLVLFLLVGVYRAHYAEPAYCPAPVAAKP